MVSNSDPMLWVARSLDHLLPTLPMPRTPACLEQRLSAGFHDQFPNAQLSDYLSRCMKERKKALDAIASIPHAISNSGINFAQVIKATLAKNPILSEGIHWEDDSRDPGNERQINRQRFSETICRIALYVKGLKILPFEMNQEVANIQRYILPPDDSMFFHPMTPVLDQLLEYLLASFALDRQSMDGLQNDLYRSCNEILMALAHHTPGDIYPIIYRLTMQMVNLPPQELWPDLIGHEAAIRKWIVSFLPQYPNMKYVLDSIEGFIWMSQQMPICPSMEEFEIALQEHRALSDQYLSFFNNHPEELFQAVSEAQRISDRFSTHAQLAFFASSIDGIDPMQMEPELTRLIGCALQKEWIETAGSPDALAGRVSELMNRLRHFDDLHQTDAPPFQSKLKEHVKRFTQPGDMIWRATPSAIEDPMIAPFKEQCLMMRTFMTAYQMNLKPHPLWNKAKILSDWEQEYFHQFPFPNVDRRLLGQWLEPCLKYAWYVHPLPHLQNRSTIRLFLEWHAAQMVHEHPGMPEGELAARLRPVIDAVLPDYPVSDYELRDVLQRLTRNRGA